jgi:homogentisate 1,2-dioxygenase
MASPQDKIHDLTQPVVAYQTGFGNEHGSEALPGALPLGRNSPQRPPYGLYTEKFSATAFTAPRADNRRTWLYRIRPSVKHGRYRRIDDALIRSAPTNEAETPPDQLRWNPVPIPSSRQDFVSGLATIAAAGDLNAQLGFAVHMYLANESMENRFFYNADGELLIAPQEGRLRIHTECGILDIAVGEVCLIPRGIKFRVVLPDGSARGYVGENYGAHLRLPERGLVGSDSFANERDFRAPVAAYEDREAAMELCCKFGGAMFACEMDHSPLDVVAWHGSCTPYKYDLRDFNAMGSISYDHPDPSIFTVLTSPSDTPGIANLDFVIFPPRWLVSENTFRPPWFHRNTMNEFMGLLYGMYDAKPHGFVPGGMSLHNCMTPHGPDNESYRNASTNELQPKHLTDTMAFMFESRYMIRPTRFAMESEQLQPDYHECWQDLPKRFNGTQDPKDF